jgi:predicted RNase H-like HicB family nuclease
MQKLMLEIFKEPLDEGNDYVCQVVGRSLSTFGDTESEALREMANLLEALEEFPGFPFSDN